MSFRERFALCMQTWQRLREHASLRAKRREIHDDLRKSFVALVDIKARALKATGVAVTDHGKLEAAIVHLAAALNDYRDAA